MILHIPHSSRVIPADLRGQLLLSDADLTAEIITMTDSYTDELFACKKATSVVFPVSRLVLDPERLLDDEQEPMSQVGMGVVYSKTSQGFALRAPLPSGEKQRLIDKYYHPHHDHLTQSVQTELAVNQHCLIIDCHSFPSARLPSDLDQSPRRPDICLGTDEFHTPTWLSDAADGLFNKQGFTTQFNSPYQGTIVPLSYYHKDPAVSSLMIEINRKLYMDQSTGLKTPSFAPLRLQLTNILNSLNSLFS